MDLLSTGIIDNESYEQSLIIQTSKGLVIVTGCAHPGILEIVKRAKGLTGQEVYLVIGGFHLMRSDESEVRFVTKELRKTVKYISPCHCTGEKAQGIFRDIFSDDYIDMQAGSQLNLAYLK